MVHREIFGILAILVGLAFIILALGDLIFRFMIAIFGLWLINYGMRLRNQPPLFTWAQRTFYRM